MQPVTLDLFSRYRFLSGLRRGPEGGLAFLAAQADMDKNNYQKDLWLKPERGEAFPLTTDGKSGNFLWDDSHTLLFASSRDPEAAQCRENGEELTTFYRIDIRGGEARKAFSVPLSASLQEKVREGVYLLRVDWDLRFSRAFARKGAAKQALLQEKCAERDYQVLDEMPFYLNGEGFTNKRRSALFLYEEAAGKLTRITRETFSTGRAHLNGDGNRLLITGQNYTHRQRWKSGIYLYDIAQKTFRELLPPRTYDVQDALWWGEKVLFMGREQKSYGINENPQFYTLDPATGEVSFFAPYEDRVGSMVGSDCRLGGGQEWMVYDGELYFTTTLRNASQVLCLKKSGEICPVYVREGSVDCMDMAEGKLYFIGMQDMKLQEVYVWDLTQGKLEQLTELNREVLADRYVALPEKLTYENGGMDLDGWVLRPKDFDPDKTYPGILDIHGGPKTVFGEVFFHEMQFWASQGYFVFFCNPRGGDGRGNAFMDLRGKYGTIDYDDLMTFTDKVLEKYPQLDTKRLCVTGGSYGGFMTNWIIGHTDRFAAAATQRSIANWMSFAFTSDIGERSVKDQMGLGLRGDIWQGAEKVWEQSPLKYFDRVTTPTLVIHSDEDYRCPLSEGYQVYAALQQRGVETRMVIFHGENHELSRSGKPRHRVRRLEEITRWFKDHISG